MLARAEPRSTPRYGRGGVLGAVPSMTARDGVVAAVRQAERDEPAFEVAFEMAEAARRVEARGDALAPEAAGSGPMWKQIQERALDSRE